MIRLRDDSADIDRFAAIVESRFGLFFDATRRPFLEEILRKRAAAAASGDAETYLSRLERGGIRSEEADLLAGELTVGETYFFRHGEQLRAFEEAVLAPWAASSPRRKLRILSAGCATGEEAYSLAILALERLPDAGPDEISIRGADLNPARIRKAEAARYSSWSLRQTPEDVRARWFRAEGKEFALSERARALATFECRNLAAEAPDLWRPGSFDAVFCRNMIMYMTPQAVEATIARIAFALAPDGLLFLGHAETLRGLSQDFHLRQTHGSFHYRRKDGPVSPPAERASAPAMQPFERLPQDDTTWIETIRTASDRVRALSGKLPSPKVAAADAAGANGGPVAKWSLAATVDLLVRERFAEALATLDRLPSQSARDPDALLLRASLLIHESRVAEAERTCEELLALDDMNAGAHYLTALCREAAGDVAGAIERDRTAAHLDPNFAMPRLHMGLLALKSGDAEGGRKDLARAIPLLRKEDGLRISLFGGGFDREVLIGLCKAETGEGGR